MNGKRGGGSPPPHCIYTDEERHIMTYSAVGERAHEAAQAYGAPRRNSLLRISFLRRNIMKHRGREGGLKARPVRGTGRPQRAFRRRQLMPTSNDRFFNKEPNRPFLINICSPSSKVSPPHNASSDPRLSSHPPAPYPASKD